MSFSCRCIPVARTSISTLVTGSNSPVSRLSCSSSNFSVTKQFNLTRSSYFWRRSHLVQLSWRCASCLDLCLKRKRQLLSTSSFYWRWFMAFQISKEKFSNGFHRLQCWEMPLLLHCKPRVKNLSGPFSSHLSFNL